jgi:hypothetical protein
MSALGRKQVLPTGSACLMRERRLPANSGHSVDIKKPRTGRGFVNCFELRPTKMSKSVVLVRLFQITGDIRYRFLLLARVSAKYTQYDQKTMDT